MVFIKEGMNRDSIKLKNKMDLAIQGVYSERNETYTTIPEDIVRANEEAFEIISKLPQTAREKLNSAVGKLNLGEKISLANLFTFAEYSDEVSEGAQRYLLTPDLFIEDFNDTNVQTYEIQAYLAELLKVKPIEAYEIYSKFLDKYGHFRDDIIIGFYPGELEDIADFFNYNRIHLTKDSSQKFKELMLAIEQPIISAGNVNLHDLHREEFLGHTKFYSHQDALFPVCSYTITNINHWEEANLPMRIRLLIEGASNFLYLDGIYVGTYYRGKSLFRQMMVEIEEKARELDKESIILTPFPLEMDNSDLEEKLTEFNKLVSIYEKYGFTVHASENAYPETDIPAVVMIKYL